MLIKRTRTPGTSRRACRRCNVLNRRRPRPPRLPAPLRPRRPAALPPSARCRSAACARRRPARRRPPARRSPSARTSARTARSAARSWPKSRTACGSARSPAGIRPINRGSHCAKGAAVRELVHGDRRLQYPMKLVNGQWTAHVLGHGDQRDRRQAAWRSARSRARIRSTGWARPSSPTKAPISTASSRRSGAPTTSITRRASVIRPRSPA